MIRVIRIIYHHLNSLLLLHLQRKKKEKDKYRKQNKYTIFDRVLQSSYANHTYFMLRIYVNSLRIEINNIMRIVKYE